MAYNLTYDAASRIKSVSPLGGEMINFSYDNDNQLKSATYSQSSQPNQSYSYDANGNRTGGSN